MKCLSFRGLVVNSREYKRVANRRFYHRHKEAEKARTIKWRKDNWDWWKSYYKKNKKKIAGNTRKSAYGITHEEYDSKMKKQKGRCAICKRKMKRPDVDHSHKTGKVRDLLCHGCNTFLGLAQESIQVLSTAIKYLRRHQ